MLVELAHINRKWESSYAHTYYYMDSSSTIFRDRDEHDFCWNPCGDSTNTGLQSVCKEEFVEELVHYIVEASRFYSTGIWHTDITATSSVLRNVVDYIIEAFNSFIEKYQQWILTNEVNDTERKKVIDDYVSAVAVYANTLIPITKQCNPDGEDYEIEDERWSYLHLLIEALIKGFMEILEVKLDQYPNYLPYTMASIDEYEEQ